MFKLTVSEDEIQATLKVIEKYVYPEHISSIYIAWKAFQQESFEVAPNEITLRKVRLCIKELRSRGYLIIAKRGYSMAGNDPEQAIHFLNGLYSRAYELTKEADIMFHEIKRKYGDEVAAKVQVMPGQPTIDFVPVTTHNEPFAEPVFQKSYDAQGRINV